MCDHSQGWVPSHSSPLWLNLLGYPNVSYKPSGIVLHEYWYLTRLLLTTLHSHLAITFVEKQRESKPGFVFHSFQMSKLVNKFSLQNDSVNQLRQCCYIMLSLPGMKLLRSTRKQEGIEVCICIEITDQIVHISCKRLIYITTFIHPHLSYKLNISISDYEARTEECCKVFTITARALKHIRNSFSWVLRLIYINLLFWWDFFSSLFYLLVSSA